MVGLPGSGKTYLSKTLNDRILIDDPKRAPNIKPNLKYVITDTHLCLPETFLQVINLYPFALYYLFENDVEQCWLNTQRRNDGRDISYEYMYLLSSKYEPYRYNQLINNYIMQEVYHDN